MGNVTGIPWTDRTFNPWWGCVKVSPGCRFCYADSQSRRYGHDVWGAKKPRRLFSDKHWADPLKWNAEAEAGVPGVRGDIGRHLVFCASMADVFEDRRDLDEHRDRLWQLIADTPSLDWQLLTKRPEHIRELVPVEWWSEWPTNVWMGTSVEDQRRADERIPQLLAVPAPVRFLSCEPLLGAVDLWGARYTLPTGGRGSAFSWGSGVRWVIVGGESGGRARPMEVAWAHDLIDQTRAANAAPFMKQMGTVWARANRNGQRPDIKGEDWSFWPEDLRVREFPS